MNLIDTNCLIYFFYNKSQTFNNWFVNLAAKDIYVSTLTMFELLKGFDYVGSKKGKEYVNEIARNYNILDFNTTDASRSSQIYNNLKKLGSRNDSLDVLIAAQALNHKLNLATFNYKYFAKIEHLKLKKFDFENIKK